MAIRKVGTETPISDSASSSWESAVSRWRPGADAHRHAYDQRQSCRHRG